ncbi:hypothetical protein GL981_11515 (plasmid) [Spiroplasma citri]|uniref:Uncharacterized protein n=1 Tax=Spiroplasma citri TaxID=2133 RepID=A0AAJ4JZ22_SPICI|nr:hypothetical protein [Spiroplasma citri]QIA69629.1 hypothetical protein GL298_09405 [Spiroplasma citri]QIA71825.1 hypothetical protein GL981_11050 [Spiroplasma citri]QIA71917.1 hypothetical protein GL981_11515 [Spiroplasma citri]QJU61807.1 hypothetical protein HHA36_05235 [Spiroplasma citri]
MTITEWIKYEKLEKENQVLKNQLAEKDKEIKNLEEKWEILVCDNYELQQTQLYKEDFEEYEEIESCGCGNKCDENGYLYACGDQITVSNFRLLSHSNYDKLPSKEDKTCI